jgi:integrase
VAHLRKPVETRKGTRYPVAWRDPQTPGKFRSKRFATRTEAKAFAKSIDTDIARGQYLDDRAGKQTFREVAEEWLDAQTRARPQTIAKYRSLLELWAFPEFGSRRLDTIKPGDIGRFVNHLKVAPLGNGRKGTMRPATMKRVLWPVSAVFDFAVEQEYLRRNPTTKIKREMPDEDSMGLDAFAGRALTWGEVTRIADQAAIPLPLHGLLVRFLARTGLRAGELSGLRVRDYEPGWVTVEQTCTRDGKAADGLRYGKPKSKTSRRRVRLGGDIDAEVREWLDAHPRKDEPDAPLFPSRTPGGERSALRTADPFDWSRPLDPGTFRRRAFEPACRRAGIVGRVRLHDLRHTCGSLWLASGVSLFNVSRYLGHSSTDFTARVYGHVLQTSAERDAELFAAYCAAEAEGEVIPLRRQA